MRKPICLVLAAMAVIPTAAFAKASNSADLAVSMTENGYQVCGYSYGCQNRIPKRIRLVQHHGDEQRAEHRVRCAACG